MLQRRFESLAQVTLALPPARFPMLPNVSRVTSTRFFGVLNDEIKACRKAGASLGGHWEIVVTGLPAGLGSYTHWDKRLDGLIGHAVLGTQAMKGVEFGQGFESGTLQGNFVHDEIIVELKAVKKLLPEHEAQLINYLAITGKKVGYLINFGHQGSLEWKRIVL